MTQKLVMEAVGTFFIALTVVFGMGSLAVGGVLMALIYIGGHISGGHYNPAVSLSMVVAGKMKLKDSLSYCLAQTVGAFSAITLIKMVDANNPFRLALPEGVDALTDMLPEVLFAFVFCAVILSVVYVGKAKLAELSGLIIGLTLAAVALGLTMEGDVAWFSVVLNPAITFGGMMCAALKSMTSEVVEAFDYGSVFVAYAVGPIVGGALAAVFVKWLNPKSF